MFKIHVNVHFMLYTHFEIVYINLQVKAIIFKFCVKKGTSNTFHDNTKIYKFARMIAR